MTEKDMVLKEEKSLHFVILGYVGKILLTEIFNHGSHHFLISQPL